MSLATLQPAAPPPVDHSDLARLPVRIEVRDDVSLEFIATSWRLLEHELQSDRLTCSSRWVETWLRYYRSLIDCRLIIGHRGDRIIGLAVATRRVHPSAGPLSIRTWHIGTAGEPIPDSVCVEFNTLLASRDDRDDFARSIHQTLAARSDCDAVSWDGFAPADLPEEFSAGNCGESLIKQTYYYDLRAARQSGAEPIHFLGDSTRKCIRQNLRGVDAPVVEWSETSAQVDEYLDELIGLHQERWSAAGQPGCFASPAFAGFHRELLHQFAPLRRGAVIRVRLGSQTLGCTLVYLDQQRVLNVQSGWSKATVIKSPGVVNDYFCILECLRRGYDAYDFMAGDSIHKARMTTDRGQLCWTTQRNSRWKFYAWDQLRKLKHRLLSFRSPAAASVAEATTATNPEERT